MTSTTTATESTLDRRSSSRCYGTSVRRPPGGLASEAGLDDTSQVHHRVREHLGPDAAGLVEQSGTEPRSGGQPDEIVYALTDDGRAFARAHEADLVDAVAAAEAVGTLRRMRSLVEGFEHRVSEVEQLVEGNDRWQNRWSTRVNRAESAIGDLEEAKADANAMEEALKERRQWTIYRKNEIQDLGDRVDTLAGRVDDLKEELAKRPTEDEVRQMIQSSREQPREWDIWLAEDIADVRERTISDRLLGR